MGRTPDYMNVTFAGFADDRPRWAGPDGEQRAGLREPRRLPEAAAARRPVADPHDRAPDRRQGDRRHLRRQPGAAAQGRRDRRLDHRPWRPAAGHAGPVRRRAGRLPRQRRCRRKRRPSTRCRSPCAMDAPGLVFLCRDSAMRPDAHPLDAPFSTRFDEQDALCLFDDVHVPKANVFIDGNIAVYNTVMGLSSWWPNIMQQTTIRALTKLEFAYGLADEDGRGGERRLRADAGDARRADELRRAHPQFVDRRGRGRHDLGGRRRLPGGAGDAPDPLDHAGVDGAGQRDPQGDRQPQPARRSERRAARRPAAAPPDERVPARRERHQRRRALVGLPGDVGLHGLDARRRATSCTSATTSPRRAPTGSPPTASTARPTEPAATSCSPS